MVQINATRTAGEGGGYVPPAKQYRHRAVLGDQESPLFDSIGDARQWIVLQREMSGDHDSDSEIIAVEV